MQAFALKSVCTEHAFCIVLGLNVPKDASLPCKEGVFLHTFVDFWRTLAITCSSVGALRTSSIISAISSIKSSLHRAW